MKKVLLTATIFLALLAGTAGEASAFTGHGCTRSTCRFFTSSYSTAKYYYDRQTCSQWKGLSSTYLHGFKSRTALHNWFPSRKLHAPC